ncbi:hypothetical protein RB653_003428 [Dictyostelium firmibasis]|uniref:tRNA:m(4)X modification enzyme TRM13 n=1 Tax=Dictyostelium firmibasis TaxID=79012 RepID=A0AAN7U815_9MYCE
MEEINKQQQQLLSNINDKNIIEQEDENKNKRLKYEGFVKKEKKKKQKIDHSIPLKEKPSQEDLDSHSECLFWIVNKKKHRAEFCKYKRAKDSTLCNHHKPIDPPPPPPPQSTSDNIDSNTSENNNQNINDNDNSKPKERKRMYCPLNPTHIIYESKLKKHLKACPNAKVGQKNAHIELSKKEPFYKENINDLNENEKVTLEPIILSQVSTENLINISVKLDQFFEKFFNKNEIQSLNQNHKSFDKIFNSDQQLKHIQQESSIINLLEKSNLYNSENIYLEFGAGSGKLSNHIFMSHEKKSGHILIDRMKFRSLKKVDRLIKNEKGCHHFSRILIDIRHLNLSNLSILQEKPFVITSKHLCGCATDFTLDSIFNLLNNSNEKIINNFKGIGIATCCHHICNFNTYSNQSFLKDQLNITPLEFQLICSISSWATIDENKCKENNDDNDDDNDDDDDDDDDDEEDEMIKKDKKEKEEFENQLKIEFNKQDVFSVKRKEELGYKAKRIIDYGRYLFIKEKLNLPNTNFWIYTNQSKENLFLVSNK